MIVLDGAIIGEGYNEVDIRHDPTSHAEIVAMRRAGEKFQRSEFRAATWVPTSGCRRTSSSTADLSEPGWPMHAASEVDIDNFQSDLVVSTG